MLAGETSSRLPWAYRFAAISPARTGAANEVPLQTPNPPVKSSRSTDSPPSGVTMSGWVLPSNDVGSVLTTLAPGR